MAEELVLVDYPLPHVKRVTMNRPEKRNALIHPLRGAILDALREGDTDDDVKVMIIRGAGPSFSAGYDLGGGNEGHELPYYTRGRRRPVAPPRHRELDEHLGPGEAGDRAGARLLPGRRQRARDRLRPRLHGRGRADGLSGGALRCARHALPPVVPRHAQGDGDDDDRRLGHRHRGGPLRLGQRARSPPTSSRPRCSRSPSASASCRSSCCSSTSGSCTARWSTWACATASAPAPSCARSARTRESMADFVARHPEKGLTGALDERDEPVRRLPHDRQPGELTGGPDEGASPWSSGCP